MRTKEEKVKLIEEYKASGLSMNKWCIANGIATSTMSTWLTKTSDKNKKSKKIKVANKTKKKAKFVEVTTPINTAVATDSKVILEYKDFKISISDSLDVLLLKDILKVVTELNV